MGVAVIVIVIALVLVSAYVIVLDVLRIIRMRKNPGLAAQERQLRLVERIRTELMDVEADGELLQAAGVFLSRAAAVGVGDRASISGTFDSIQLDDLNVASAPAGGRDPQ